MKITETSIPGLIIIEPKVFEDERGYFFESYKRELFQKAGIEVDFVQDNQSKSVKNVLRGLHYQIEPYAQAKLVRVFSGTVLDIAVDIRVGSPTYGKWDGIILSGENKKQLFIPRGFAHGFFVLSNEAEFFYKCDNVYSKAHEGGIRFDDPEIGIEWGGKSEEYLLSEKDKELPFFKDCLNNFVF